MLSCLLCDVFFAVAVDTIPTVPMGGEVSVLILTGGEVVLWPVGGGGWVGASTDHTLLFCRDPGDATVPVAQRRSPQQRLLPV